MPFFMAASHWLHLKRRDEEYRTLTKAWSKGVAIFFAVGAVSGTALSFELGLLWPRFMEHAGPIIGMAFSWEGTAFFLEAIALGFFLYGWDRVPAWVHWTSGLLVGIFGVASALLQPLTGDIAARSVALRQPVKLAAMEGLLKLSGEPFWPSEVFQTRKKGSCNSP